MASRIDESKSHGMWVPHGMFPDWFRQQGFQREMSKSCWWRSIQWKRGGIKGTRNSRTESVNVFSPGSSCCLTENFIERNIIGEYCVVTSEYWLMSRCIGGEMNHLARCINFNRMWATSAWILLGSAVPKGPVSIRQTGNQSVEIITNAITDGSRYRMDNSLQWSSKERQRLLVL